MKKPRGLPERAQENAREAGRNAFASNGPMPEGYRATKSLSEAWREGYKEAQREAGVIRVPEVDVRTPETPPASTRGNFLPEGQEIPGFYLRTPREHDARLACANCRATRDNQGGQAVIVETTRKTTVVLRCKMCREAREVPIRDLRN